jgi:hypothetical protein
MQDASDTKICRYEKPWDNVRCNREDCSYDHLWGRVRFILKMKKKKSSDQSDDESTSSATGRDMPKKPLNRDVDLEAMGVDPDDFDKTHGAIHIIPKKKSEKTLSAASGGNSKLNEAFDSSKSDDQSSICSSISGDSASLESKSNSDSDSDSDDS